MAGRGGVTQTLMHLGQTATDRGHSPSGIRLRRRALAIFEGIGDHAGSLFVRQVLASIR